MLLSGEEGVLDLLFVRKGSTIFVNRITSFRGQSPDFFGVADPVKNEIAFTVLAMCVRADVSLSQKSEYRSFTRNARRAPRATTIKLDRYTYPIQSGLPYEM